MKLTRYKTFFIYVGLIVITLVVGLYIHWPTLTDEYVILDDDVMQHTFWMNRFHDPELFQGDMYADYANSYLPLGFKAVYYLGTYFVDQKLVGKILAIILYAVSGIYLFNLGKRMGNNYTGFLLFFLFICFPVHIDRFLGGQFRSFSFPLLIAFLYYLFDFNFKVCILFMMLMVLFYPPNLLTAYSVLIVFLLLERKRIKEIRLGRSFIGFFLPLIIFFVFLCYKNFTKPEILGNVTDIGVILANLDNIVYGRSKNLPVQDISVVIKDLIVSHKLFPLGFIIFFFSWLYYAIKKRYDLLVPYHLVVALFVSSVLMYQISSLFLIKLYLPITYVRYSFPLVGLFVIIMGVEFILRRINNELARRVILTVIIAATWFFHGNSINKIYSDVNQTQYRDVYQYISQLPKNITIAANPYLSDFISTFSERKTFLKYELSFPWFEGYARTVEKRIADFYKAYYSENLKDLYIFSLENNIDFIVFNRDDYEARYLQSNNLGIDVVSHQIKEMINSKKNFAVNLIDPRKILYQSTDGKIFIVKADKHTLEFLGP